LSSDSSSAASSIRIFVAFLVARAIFGLALLGASVRRFPIPWYYPLERRWAMGTVPQGLGMAWFGATLYALLAAAAAGGLVVVLFRSRRAARALSVRGTVLGIARAGALIMLLDFAYFGWTMTHQTPSPLPAECEARASTNG
jgi:hypothetical protein